MPKIRKSIKTKYTKRMLKIPKYKGKKKKIQKHKPVIMIFEDRSGSMNINHLNNFNKQEEE